MSSTFDKTKLKALATELAKVIKTEKDLSNLSRALLKLTVEIALNKELDEHLGYEKHAIEGRNTGNNRNGSSAKIFKGDHGEVVIDTPRDRVGSFEPQLIKKNQTRLTQFDEQILCLYARARQHAKLCRRLKRRTAPRYHPTLISKVIDAMIDQVIAWQSRPLDAAYPILYLDCIVLRIRQDKRVINKSIYLALGTNTQGTKNYWVWADCQNRRCKVLACCAHRITTAWRKRRVDWLCRWLERLS